MAEESLGHRLDEMLRVRKTREEVGIPPSEEINTIMQEVLPSAIANIVKVYVGDKEKALNNLSKYKISNEKNLSRPLSKPVLCASFLLANFGNIYRNVAVKAFDQDNVSLFRFFFDFSSGIRLSSNRILSTEDETVGGAMDAMDASVISHTGKTFNLPVGEEADIYLHIKQENTKSLELLRKDPSGFELMDDSVKRIKAGSFPGILPIQPTEYVLAGAEVTRDLYKKFYGIAAPLYPQGQSKSS